MLICDIIIICITCWQEYRNQPARQIVRRYRQRQQQQALISDANGDCLLLARSLHVCGYPDCGKQFRHKHNLRRHQTQKHGRMPKRILGVKRVWMKPGDLNDREGFSTTGTDFISFIVAITLITLLMPVLLRAAFLAWSKCHRKRLSKQNIVLCVVFSFCTRAVNRLCIFLLENQTGTKPWHW